MIKVSSVLVPFQR